MAEMGAGGSETPIFAGTVPQRKVVTGTVLLTSEKVGQGSFSNRIVSNSKQTDT